MIAFVENASYPGPETFGDPNQRELTVHATTIATWDPNAMTVIVAFAASMTPHALAALVDRRWLPHRETRLSVADCAERACAQICEQHRLWTEHVREAIDQASRGAVRP